MICTLFKVRLFTLLRSSLDLFALIIPLKFDRQNWLLVISGCYPAQPRLPAPADMMDLVVEPQQCTGYSAHCVPRLAVRMYDV